MKTTITVCVDAEIKQKAMYIIQNILNTSLSNLVNDMLINIVKDNKD